MRFQSPVTPDPAAPAPMASARTASHPASRGRKGTFGQATRILVGAPVDSGSGRRGCLMGPDAYRTAGIVSMLASLGHDVQDRGNLCPEGGAPPFPVREDAHANPVVHDFSRTLAWTRTLRRAAREAAEDGFPIFLGGDHSLSLGTMAGIADHAKEQERPLFVLWLDAHPDFHSPLSTRSGNLHGTPLAYAAGEKGFDGFPPFTLPLEGQQICVFGARSIDGAEHERLIAGRVCVHDMRAVDEAGIIGPISDFLDRVIAADGLLHVSLDVDFLDPEIAPAVGTTVPGGATFREAHLVMELLHDSGRVTSLDLVELNPFLDVRGRTARLMVDLTASLMGRKVFDRPTRSY